MTKQAEKLLLIIKNMDQMTQKVKKLLNFSNDKHAGKNVPVLTDSKVILLLLAAFKHLTLHFNNVKINKNFLSSKIISIYLKQIIFNIMLLWTFLH